MCHDLHGRGHGQLRCTLGIGFLDEDSSSSGCGTGFNTSQTRPQKQCGGTAFDDGELLQRMNSEAMMHEATTIWKNAHTKDASDWMPDQDRVIMTKEDDASTSYSDIGTNGSGHGDSDSNRLRQVESKNEFGNTELEDLVKSEGPQKILQLIL